MGELFFSGELIKVQQVYVLFGVLVSLAMLFSKYSTVSLDWTTCLIFIGMCLAGYFTLKAAKEILIAFEENKQSADEKNSQIVVSPVAFNKNLKLTKYTTSTNSQSILMPM